MQLSERQADMSDECQCGLTPPTTFPAEPVRGDWCPIGPLNLHHWHGTQCVFCSRTRVLTPVEK